VSWITTSWLPSLLEKYFQWVATLMKKIAPIKDFQSF